MINKARFQVLGEFDELGIASSTTSLVYSKNKFNYPNLVQILFTIH